jgi:hypothetical protein
MVSIGALDSLTPADLWREVPLEQEFWEQARERQRRPAEPQRCGLRHREGRV